MRLLKDPKKAQFKDFLLGKNMTRKALTFRILYSIGCGVVCPILINTFLQGEVPHLFFHIAIPLITLATYFLGYPWCAIPFLRNELQDRK